MYELITLVYYFIGNEYRECKCAQKLDYQLIKKAKKFSNQGLMR